MKFTALPNVFHLRDALRLGFTSADLLQGVASGQLERRMRGVYRKAESEDLGAWTSYEVLAKGLKCDFAVCLLSALSYHGLSDQIVDEPWIMIDHRSAISHPNLHILRVRNPMWDFGISKIEGIPITNIERTVVDSLVYVDKVSPNEAHGALMKCLSQRKATPWGIAEMAKHLGFERRIGKYLEPFVYAS